MFGLAGLGKWMVIYYDNLIYCGELARLSLDVRGYVYGKVGFGNIRDVWIIYGAKELGDA